MLLIELLINIEISLELFRDLLRIRFWNIIFLLKVFFNFFFIIFEDSLFSSGRLFVKIFKCLR